MENQFCWLLIFVFVILLSESKSDKKAVHRLPGHLKPLGSHKDAEGVTITGGFPSSSTFYRLNVRQSKPLWFRNALELTEHPGFTNWTDDYLREVHGGTLVSLEYSKKENRSQSSTSLRLRQFLHFYTEEDLYLVNSMRDSMEDFVLVPPLLQCGGFQNIIHDSVLWLGNEKTSSVLHYDKLDNILCVMDGRKELVLIDKSFKEDVEANGFVEKGSYSLVDTDKVDMDKFPRLANVTWKQISLSKGDCAYIPNGWYNQVNSYGKRHLAVNYWFSPLYWFNSSDCSRPDKPVSQYCEPIKKINGFASTNEVLRSELLKKFQDDEILAKYIFLEKLDTSTEERRESFFNAIDKYKDDVLSGGEMYGFDIDAAVLYFPDIFGIPGEGEDLPEDLSLHKSVSRRAMNSEDSVTTEDQNVESQLEVMEASNKVRPESNIEEESVKHVDSTLDDEVDGGDYDNVVVASKTRDEL